MNDIKINTVLTSLYTLRSMPGLCNFNIIRPSPPYIQLSCTEHITEQKRFDSDKVASVATQRQTYVTNRNDKIMYPEK
jgi:hypothetical protein